MEINVTGTGFQPRSRFAKFTNVPELLGMFHRFGDVMTAADLNLPTPPIAQRPGDAQRLPEILTVPKSPQLAAFIGDLDRRVEAIRTRAVAPEVDNMLKVSTHGRLAALDLRLVLDEFTAATIDPATRSDAPTSASTTCVTSPPPWPPSRAPPPRSSCSSPATATSTLLCATKRPSPTANATSPTAWPLSPASLRRDPIGIHRISPVPGSGHRHVRVATDWDHRPACAEYDVRWGTWRRVRMSPWARDWPCSSSRGSRDRQDRTGSGMRWRAEPV